MNDIFEELNIDLVIKDEAIKELTEDTAILDRAYVDENLGNELEVGDCLTFIPYSEHEFYYTIEINNITEDCYISDCVEQFELNSEEEFEEF